MDTLDTLRAEYDQLGRDLSDPAAHRQPDYGAKAKRHSALKNIIELSEQQTSLRAKIKQAQALSGERELQELAQQDIADYQAQLDKIENLLKEQLAPVDPDEARHAIVEIRAATGGDEASLFAADLYRMYTRYAERKGWKIELISESPSEAGGFKEIIFRVDGGGAFGRLRYEAGVHRVQRVPVTESQGRIHTSTTTVAVLPEAEETDVAIEPGELRIDVFRSSGHGGQSVNTTDSAVRITHLPTGLVVTCQDEKSQTKNKEKALGVLRSRLLAQKIDEQLKERSHNRRQLIGAGQRSEKIRTYNFPQDRITDHRVGYSRSNVNGALEGEIDDVIDALQAYASGDDQTNDR